MSYHVLLAVDDSEQSRKALEYVGSQHADDVVTALHVIAPAEASAFGDAEGGKALAYEEVQQQRRESSEELLETTRERAQTLGLDISTAIETGDVEQELVAYAEDHDVDQIVIGSHGRTGASRVLLGSVAEKVARRSPVPVTIVR